MTDFNDVWVWGNPLFEDGASYAAQLDNHVSYMMLATVTRMTFSRTRNAWLQELFRAGLTTDKLLEAMRYYLEAQRQHIEPRQHIANCLNWDLPQVSRLLMFVDVTEVLGSPHLLASGTKTEKEHVYSKKKYRAPTSREIRKMMAYIKHPCAAGYPGCHNEILGRFPICFSCYKHLGGHNESAWDDITRKWLPKEIKRINKQWQRDARSAWYKQNYIEISAEELDELLEAQG